VESEPGRGSRFFFTVELDLPAAPIPLHGQATLDSLHRLRTLVVDDNDSARTMVKELVQSFDWACDTAATGEEALAKIIAAKQDQQGYDAIFMDWSMPGMDGWEASRRIHELSARGEAPLIVMVTMHDRERIAERAARESSVLDAFLVKPVTGSMLLDAVADARAGRGMEPRPAGVPKAEREAGRLAGMRLLVVEDNATNQQVARELLEAEGAHVDVASGGGEAIRMLADHDGHYDAVLMDIQMPDMDGYTATRRIRSTLGLKSLPIIAMTANVLVSDREACLAAGMNDHIGKPFDLNLVVERLLHWTGRGIAAPVQQAGAVAVDPTASMHDEVLDWTPALARFGGKQRAYLGALERFPDAAAEIQRELQQALANGQRESVDRQLHTLKGLAAMIGARRLGELCRQVEQSLRSAAADWQASGSANGLQQAIDEASSAARLLQARLDNAVAQAPAASIAPLNTAELEELMTLLETSNLRAVEVYERIGPSLAVEQPQAAARIKQALDQLDMPTALEACLDVLDEKARTSP
jgi:two-component system sensor histidine kinase/response regulator